MFFKSISIFLVFMPNQRIRTASHQYKKTMSCIVLYLVFYEYKNVPIIILIYLHLGKSSLMNAARNSHTDTVNKLLKYGANVNTKINNG